MKKYKVYTKEKCLIETNDINDFLNLTWHREDGPAYTRYRKNGNIECEAYYVKDKKHRLDGPALINYSCNGIIEYYEYWINCIRYAKGQYEKELLKLKVQSI